MFEQTERAEEKQRKERGERMDIDGESDAYDINIRRRGNGEGKGKEKLGEHVHGAKTAKQPRAA